MRLSEIVQEYRRFGAVKTLQDLIVRGANRLLTAKILKGIRIEAAQPEFLKRDESYRGEFLSEADTALRPLLDPCGQGRDELRLLSGVCLRRSDWPNRGSAHT
jgi:hypothetical protein